jgi:3-oxoacyl-[acyl-carrier protein] reductase
MDLAIKGRTALILGAGGGIGSAVAVALAREGCRIALADISQEALERTVGQINGLGVQHHTLCWDLADHVGIEARIAAVEANLGPIDILFNNTGGPPPTPAAGQDPALWRKQFEAMVMSVITITDRVLPGMRQRRWGRIITSTSSGVVAPLPNLAISNALRLSLVGWSKTLAREVAREAVTVNVVVPGRIATARTRSLDAARAQREGRSVEAVADESAAGIPMGRYGEPGEYADAVAFLASKRASYITGSVLRVDGGLIASV